MWSFFCVCVCVCVCDIGLQKIHPMICLYKVLINKTFVTFVICDLLNTL